LREIVAECLAKDPADRPTLGSLAAQINARLGGQVSGIEPRGLSFWPPTVAAHIERFRALLETELGAAADESDAADETLAIRTASLPVHPEPPVTIRAAASLMYAGAAYALVFAAFSWLIAVVHSGHPLVVWQGHWRIRTLTGLTVLGIADCCVQFPLWLWLAQACKHAKSWPRTASLVLFAGYTAASGYALVMHTRDRVDTLGTALFAVTWLIGAATLVLLWLRPSRAYLTRGAGDPRVRSEELKAVPRYRRRLCRCGYPNVKHWVRSLSAGLPSRGGNGAPLASLLVSGVPESNWWLMDASVGSPNTVSMNFSTELWSEKAVSTYPGLACGETMSMGTRMPGP
jgi:hypothetical protein